MSMSLQENFSLEDRYHRYHRERGVVLISGVQALVRALMTQAQLDRQRGMHTGGFVSGYRGSPLGGLDKELWSRAPELTELGVHFQPGINEDLAATAVWGSQQVGLHAGQTVEGVFGLWYGKAPGLDRSCDAIRHANAWGTSAAGGVLLVVGDDPAAKSSSLSSQSEFTLRDLMVPVLAPASVQEVLDFSIVGWEMSRMSGLWVGIKAIADHMDASATVEVGLDRYPKINVLEPHRPHEDRVHIRRQDSPQAQEHRLLNQKLPMAVAFAREAKLNKWMTKNLHGHRGHIGIVCAGKAYADVREGLSLMGLASSSEISAAGIELLKLGMTWPLDEQLVAAFAHACDVVMVVEEKQDFVEAQVKASLYGKCQTPVVGKTDTKGSPLIANIGILEPVEIARALYPFVVGTVDEKVRDLFNRVDKNHALVDGSPARQERTPLFCAGCPHNTSTRLPAGSRATAGIGCHYMVQWMDRETDSCSHMGGEGISWVGEAPFTKEEHIFANLGDGTYFHSGILAIRQAVAAKVNITYKVLFNEAVAMTGGQPVDGELTVAKLLEQVKAEGVAQVVVVSDQPAQTVLPGVAVYHRRQLDQVQSELREVKGTTVLVYQQACATEMRRKRKRGLEPDNKPRLFINEAVCEGCGDCTEVSNCVAVEPLDTPLGIKRKINQTACNKDLSCGVGFCPAFVEVHGGTLGGEGPSRSVGTSRSVNADAGLLRDQVPEPKWVGKKADILIAGVGGTGIVTLSAILGVAAKIENRETKILDMTGLAQKGGAVFSHVRIDDKPIHTARIPLSSATSLVGCDWVSAASTEALELVNANTIGGFNAEVSPTSDFVMKGKESTPLAARKLRLHKVMPQVKETAASRATASLFGDTAQGNVFMLGFVFQLGGIPLRSESICRAIEINDQAVAKNLAAFLAGRRAALATHVQTLGPSVIEQSLVVLVSDHQKLLVDYQGSGLAQKYLELVQAVQRAEQHAHPGSEQVTRAVALSYLKVLMAKDEYEVARLHTSAEFVEQLRADFGPQAKVKFLLAPPILGNKKRRFGAWMRVVFKGLAGVRRIRNTWLDPFAFSAERKQEHELREDFVALCHTLIKAMNRQNIQTAASLATLYLEVRGYGHVKARAVEVLRKRKQALLVELYSPGEPVRWFDPLDGVVADKPPQTSHWAA